MALTKLQRRVCKLVAERRRVVGESYVAGGVALNDLDLFHDTHEAVASSALENALATDELGLHQGSIRGALPVVRAR